MTKATNITWHNTLVDKEQRRQLNGHGSAMLWLTGLSASGKSTLATALDSALYARGVRSYILDGDNIRHGLNSNLGFSPEDRSENIRRIGEVGKLFVEAGLFAITAFISPYRVDRDAVRARMAAGEFIEVYVKCDIATCEQRDPKGLYKKARAGLIKDFTGIDAPYEEPLEPELVLETAQSSVEECVASILVMLEDQGLLAHSSRPGRDTATAAVA